MPRGRKKEVEIESAEEKTNSIKLAKGYRLCQDRFCCWIEQEKTVEKRGKDRKPTGKTKKEWQRVAGYCPTYESLFIDFYQKRCFTEIEGKEATVAIQNMAQMMEETKEMIQTLLKSPNKKER